MPRRLQLTGQRFGRLLVMDFEVRHFETYNAVYWRCACDCGKEVWVVGGSLTNGRTRSCGCLKAEKDRVSGEKSHAWKGGLSHRGGYTRVYVKNENGRAHYKNEHQLIMEKHLGRPLYPGETIHHKNGVHGANEIDNLELWVTSHPAGQRPEDLLVWAREVIRRYGS